MVTKPDGPDEEPEPAVKVERAIREIVAGHPQGAVRRILLYVLLVVGITLTAVVPPVGLLLGLSATVLLLATDVVL